MGIAPTGAIFRGLTFDGENSKDYGIYITGTGVYNAPERDVEMIAIPGRNGNFALDNGRFANVEVTYHCGLFGPSQADFSEAISDFRNMLMSRRGYVRLTDDYNADEYRMAIYKSGLEVTADAVRAGEFDLVFDCKPQRFLTSGETAVSVASGDTLTNPTLFDAHPLLAVDGTGEVSVGGENINVSRPNIGRIVIGENGLSTSGRAYMPDYDVVNVGDNVTVDNMTMVMPYRPAEGVSLVDRPEITSVTWSKGNGTVGAFQGDEYPFFYISAGSAAYLYQTNTILWRAVIYADFTGEDGDGNALSASYVIDVRITATSNGRFSIVTHSIEKTSGDDIIRTVQYTEATHARFGTVTADSSKALTETIMVDLETGDAYSTVSGQKVSANSAVILPSELPVLIPGDNTVTFDAAITGLSVTPRWWKV